ncbi:MAG: hypothetical protein CM15mP127_12890 [Gammaproteobacteria bacterium]|nr:MAG: hypothetical protein CM15mP127_12890 [Gammaproteobacteria bacterium]
MLIAIPLIGQTLTNHSEKLTIKRKVFNLSSYADFDFRTTNERGFYYRHLDIGVNFPLAKHGLHLCNTEIFIQKEWEMEA